MDSLEGCESVGSTQIRAALCWNTSFSRTCLTSKQTIGFSEPGQAQLQGLGDVLTTVEQLQLERCSYDELIREDTLGEGETFWVEKCEWRGRAVAVKHLKLSPLVSDTAKFLRRLHQVLLELRIMHHRPLRNHPNIISLLAYGWNMRHQSILPYVIVEYSALGTLREHLQGTKLSTLLAKEIAIADVASGLSALHETGIIHSDVKLDNVLVYRSWERPSGTIAKISDFGHSIVVETTDNRRVQYLGTSIYNAPETLIQQDKPIEREDLRKCDNWSFGLLALETLLDGRLYTEKMPVAVHAGGGDGKGVRHEGILAFALSSVRGYTNDIQGGFIRSLFRSLLQIDPQRRLSDLTELGIMRKWHATGTVDLTAKLAMHSGSAEWSYEMFRPKDGPAIEWEHQQQIARDFERCYNDFKADPQIARSAAWQVGVCYYEGFGVPVDVVKALEYTKSAMELDHPLTQMLDTLFPQTETVWNKSNQQSTYTVRTILQLRTKPAYLNDDPSTPPLVVFLHRESDAEGREMKFTSYADFVSWSLDLVRDMRLGVAFGSQSQLLTNLIKIAISFQDPRLLKELCSFPSFWIAGNAPLEPFLVQACRTGRAELVRILLKAGADPGQEDAEGRTFLHWLFLLDSEAQPLAELLLDSKLCLSKVDTPSNAIHSLHLQWPLQLTGSPLSHAISVGSMSGVRALLTLGANPFAPAYHKDSYLSDHRHTWNAFHVAVKYHNHLILRILQESVTYFAMTQRETPLACALSFSSYIERKALHGIAGERALKSVLHMIGLIEPLGLGTADGITGLYQAIDFNDIAVVRALLRHNPALAYYPFIHPQHNDRFHFPIHFAAQIAAHRDVAETLDILKVLFSYEPDEETWLDSDLRTPLHLAVTGSSAIPAKWFLELKPELQSLRDKEGRTALHYCSTVANAELLLASKAKIDDRAKDGYTPLHRAAAQGAGHLVQLFCKWRANVDTTDHDQRTPLHSAVMCSCREVMIALIDAGAAVNRVDMYGDTPLNIAVRKPRTDLVALLLAHGADPSISNNYCQSPLYFAILYSNLFATKLLVKSTTQTWFADQEGNTALHICARNGNVEMTSVLAAAFNEATYLNQINGKGETALHVACFYGRTNVAHVLLEAGADPNSRSPNGDAPLHTAVRASQAKTLDETNREDIYSLLISSGASLASINNDGDMPWDIAVRGRDLNAIWFFLSTGDMEACRNLTRFKVQQNKGIFVTSSDQENREDVRDIIFKDAVESEDARLILLLVQKGYITLNTPNINFTAALDTLRPEEELMNRAQTIISTTSSDLMVLLGRQIKALEARVRTKTMNTS